MKLSTFLRESAKEESDRFYRQLAISHWKKIEKFLEDHSEEPDYGLTKHPKYNGFIITPKEIPGRKDLGVLLIPKGSLAGSDAILIPDKNIGGGIGRVKGGFVIVIPVLKGPYDTTYLDTRWSGTRKTFIHEFIQLTRFFQYV